MKVRKILLFVVMLNFFACSAHAEEKLVSWWNESFQAAESHPGLIHAYEPFKPEKIKKYVVLLKDGIPAEQAPHFISWQDYDYRAVLIKGDKITTHRGSVSTKLRKGDILAVISPDHFSHKLYVKLMTPEIYNPENNKKKKFSRVTVMLGFSFPHAVFKKDDQSAVEEKLGQWLTLFSTRAEAEQFSASLAQAAPSH